MTKPLSTDYIGGMSMEGIALVTGRSAGIGFETSLALARNGIHTFATTRHLQTGSIIETIADKESHPICTIF